MDVMCICGADGLTLGRYYMVFSKESDGYYVYNDNGEIKFYWDYYFVE